MTLHQLDTVLLIGAAVLLVAVASVRLSSRAGLPSLLIYLAIGMLLGDAGFGIRFGNPALTQVLGVGALVVILAEGGLTTPWSVVRPVLPFAVVLSTAGVAVSVAVVAAAAHLLLGMSWQAALLAGAIVSSTDAAAVFATLRRLPLRPRVAAVLEAESGLNDAPVVLLVTLLSVVPLHDVAPARLAALVAYELVAGAVVGVAVGLGGAWVLRRSALPAAGLYPLAAVALTVLAYAVAGVAHASGILAVYAAGLVLGNSRLPHRRAVLGFAEGLAWLAQIGLFVLLGLLVSPRELGPAVLPALVIGAVLLFAGRPLSVLASASWFGAGPRVQLFLSWAGLRGAVPIVLATIPYAAGVPEGRRLFDIVFVLVVVFTLLQGATLPPVARLAGVVDPARASDLQVEVAPLEDIGADLLAMTIPPGSRMHGVYVGELRLPPEASVVFLLRQGRRSVPDSGTRLRVGDSLLVVAAAGCREETERRLHAIGRSGRLARWFADGNRGNGG
ncbi:MAG TPA: potassium/proton antiporter [Mycobacteriales bacterium]